MQMAPDHNRLEMDLTGFQQLSAQNNQLLTNSDFLKTQEALQVELQQLNALAKNLSDAKATVDNATDRISRLNGERDAYAARRVGKAQVNPFASAVNFFGKVVVGHSVVDTEAVFSSREEKADTIADIQAQIDAAQQGLPAQQAALDDVQKKYDNFLGALPWGQD
jgi:hypothetical protein